MGLKGSLDEFCVQDILQILSIGRKSGYLSLETPAGGGAIVFRDGRILASFDAGGPPLANALVSVPECQREEVIRQRIAASLDRLARCRRGEFSFHVAAQPPPVVDGRDIAPETLRSGIDVIELLLQLACRQDEEERDSHSGQPRREAAAPGADRLIRPAEPLAGAGSELSVLLVDDEALVRRLLARYLVEGGYQVVEAGDVESAVKRGASLGEAGVRFVLVADLNMPASAGDSFRGGFEVVKRLARLRLRPPVVIMADSASASLRALPKRGIWSVVLKPGLSKLHPEEFEADMRALAGTIVQEVLPKVCGALPA